MKKINIIDRKPIIIENDVELILGICIFIIFLFYIHIL